MGNDDEPDQAVIDAIRACGPKWIPDDDAQRMVEEILAEAEDKAVLEDYRARQATAQVTVVPTKRCARS